MMRYLLMICNVFFSSAVYAETVTVRSGEHANFSRLTFEFSESVPWQLGRVEGGYELRVKKTGISYNLSGAFDRISQTRVSGLTPSKNPEAIVIVMGCDCHADAFEFRPGLLVVDIKDGKPLKTSTFEQSFSADETSYDSIPVVRDDSVQSNTGTAASGLFLPTNLPRTSTSFGPGVFSVAEDGPHTDSAGNQSVVVRRTYDQVRAIQSSVAQQIGHAASQGLLEPSIERPRYPRQERTDAQTDASEIQEETVESSENIEDISAHIQTSIDRERTGSAAQRNIVTAEGTCLAEEIFQVPNWGTPSKIIENISNKNRALVGEFDIVNADAHRELVQSYIYAGFGVEAIAVINGFDYTLDNVAIFEAMARILDYGSASLEPSILTQTACDSPAALWGVLAQAELTKGMDINVDAVILSFSDLPAHLRRHLGPNLSQKFLDIADDQTAQAIRDAVARASNKSTPELLLLDARFDQVRGNYKEAENKLDEIISGDSQVAPVALIELLEEQLHRAQAVDARMIALAESYIYEQQNSKTAQELLHLLVLAYGQSNEYMKALGQLRQLDRNEGVVAESYTTSLESILTEVTKNANDETFVRFIYAAQKDIFRSNISQEVRIGAAERLVEMGFGKMSKKILGVQNNPTKGQRIILAKTLFLNDEFNQAIEMLKGIQSDEAITLRAEIYERGGVHMTAAQEYGLISDYEGQRRSYWRAGNWSQLEETGSSVEMAAAEIMMNQNGSQISTPAMLAGNKGLLESSALARRAITEIIDNFPKP